MARRRTPASSRRAPGPELLELVAGRFRALAEPARLAILQSLHDSEHTVTELVQATGLTQANLSRHLQQLLASGFVRRRREGLFAYYALADRDVLALCDIMCSRVEGDVARHRRAVGGG
jgi:DNA-binding transcriptional ArsR family regulator